MVKVILMVGLQGSGKSLKALELSKQYNAIVLSSDSIRKEFNNQIDNNTVFKKLYKAANELLTQGKNIIIDATNTTRKSRRSAIDSIRKKDVEIIAYIMTTPYEICLQRLKRRSELGGLSVPPDALKRYYLNFEIPFYEEGFNDIIIDNCEIPICHDISKEYSLIDYMNKFVQKNKWHKLTVGQHCKKCYKNIEKITLDRVLLEAAFWHDIGKLFTQIIDEEGNGHYYSHANVGTYFLLSNLEILATFICKCDILDVLFYVNYHMYPFNFKEDKTIAKWKKIFGKEKFNKLMILNQADKTSRGYDEN